jgi:hypothetical protein
LIDKFGGRGKEDSEFERWFVVSAATILAAVDVATVERLRTR